MVVVNIKDKLISYILIKIKDKIFKLNMKKLLTLLLFIPLVSFSQTFEEIITINSEDTFKRVAIENNYEFYQEKDGVIFYGWGLDGDKAQMWATYTKDTKLVVFQFKKDELFGHTPQFKEITKNIK